MTIDPECVVSIHYTLTDGAGEVLDSSEGGEPLSYVHGSGALIPGLLTALTGKATGDSLKVKVDPAEGYGERREELVQEVPRTAFQSDQKVEPGMQFVAQSPEGQQHTITVREVGDEQVTVDGNHPLAGVELHFDVKIVDVRRATPEEVQAGQPG